jgi:hypothetical protein
VKQRFITAIPFAVAFVVCGLFVGGWMVFHLLFSDEALARAFAQVQRGDSPARVIELFGQSAQVTTNVETNINWDETWDKTNGIKCVRQFHFYPPFTICGESWVVGFDEHSNAVAKYHLVSP